MKESELNGHASDDTELAAAAVIGATVAVDVFVGGTLLRTNANVTVTASSGVELAAENPVASRALDGVLLATVGCVVDTSGVVVGNPAVLPGVGNTASGVGEEFRSTVAMVMAEVARAPAVARVMGTPAAVVGMAGVGAAVEGTKVVGMAVVGTAVVG